MKKQHIFILLGTIILLVGIYFTFAHAHPGRTDSNGGHYVSDTDEYHYHHDYPAHQHPNGVCPYDSYISGENNNDNSSKNKGFLRILYDSVVETFFWPSVILAIIYGLVYISEKIKERKK